MTDTTASDRSVPQSPAPSHFRMTRRGGLRSIGVLALLLAVAIGSYTLGRRAADREVKDYKLKTEQLQEANSKLTAENKKQAETIGDLQDQLRSAKDELDKLFRPARTLEINANKSQRVSIGLLTIGLVGTPRNESVDLKIDGKQQSAAAGEVINVEFSTACRIHVMSFDVLKSSVAIDTTCGAVKP